jgi:hypothetical protein
LSLLELLGDKGVGIGQEGEENVTQNPAKFEAKILTTVNGNGRCGCTHKCTVQGMPIYDYNGIK